jgi:hypothetical protein
VPRSLAASRCPSPWTRRGRPKSIPCWREVIGCTGTAAALSTLVLAFPCVVDADGELATAGSTTVLTKAAVRLVAPLLQPPGASFERTFAWGTHEPSTVIVVEPLVVQGEADASVETGVLRRAARLHRARRPRSRRVGVADGGRLM